MLPTQSQLPMVPVPIPSIQMRNNQYITHLSPPDLLHLPSTDHRMHSKSPINGHGVSLQQMQSRTPAMGRISFSNTENQHRISQALGLQSYESPQSSQMDQVTQDNGYSHNLHAEKLIGISNEALQCQCVESFSPPCILCNSSWVRADNTFISGTFGNLYRVRERAENGCVDGVDYIMKFVKKDRSSITLKSLSETSVAQTLKEAESMDLYKKYLLETYPLIFGSFMDDEWEWMSAPTITVHETDARLEYDLSLIHI